MAGLRVESRRDGRVGSPTKRYGNRVALPVQRGPVGRVLARSDGFMRLDSPIPDESGHSEHFAYVLTPRLAIMIPPRCCSSQRSVGKSVVGFCGDCNTCRMGHSWEHHQLVLARGGMAAIKRIDPRRFSARKLIR